MCTEGLSRLTLSMQSSWHHGKAQHRHQNIRHLKIAQHLWRLELKLLDARKLSVNPVWSLLWWFVSWGCGGGGGGGIYHCLSSFSCFMNVRVQPARPRILTREELWILIRVCYKVELGWLSQIIGVRETYTEMRTLEWMRYKGPRLV